ncbi:phospho-glucose isomerase C-terminal SIS domain-containing protein [Deinococcus reticulitermitis]|uniref:Phospho-glucose isomerase C-terminal SIS domain-containing protein n=1 Tax=Deinococcus reticulitermitis TaxID=856736 RepID=A0A1H6VVS3_9DEIO|nr:SIS domain-containing protein [Deinococcus reticulitermitis]SEJ05927.1 phospho-glucose isomerase C-terminal SIS domain-containing protein [Deinococcus reticulitermitis]
MTTDFLTLLARLPGSYAGPTRAETGPYAVVGSGEGTLAAQLAQTLPGVRGNFTRTGTQFVLFSPDAQDAARTYAELAEVAGAGVRRIGTGGQAADLDVLVPGGTLATYHFAQALAYGTGHAEDAQAADMLLADLARRCSPEVGEGENPARVLAWSLWGRSPLLIAGEGSEALSHAWQHLLARVGKTLGVPVLGDALPFVTGAFEAQHERGDGRVALVLGDLDPALGVAQEVLESRIDEVIAVPVPGETGSAYAGGLALWYLGAWVAAYLAERYGQPAEDSPVLARAQAVLAGEGDGEQLGGSEGSGRRPRRTPDDLDPDDLESGARGEDEEDSGDEEWDED